MIFIELFAKLVSEYYGYEMIEGGDDRRSVVEDIQHVVLQLVTVQALELTPFGRRLLHVLIAVLSSVLYLGKDWDHLVHWFAALLLFLPVQRQVGHLVAGLFGLANLDKDGVTAYIVAYSLWTIGQGGGEDDVEW